MQKRVISSAVAVATLALVSVPTATHAATVQTNDQKVTICHRTDAVNNPYVRIDISTAAAYGGHTDEHAGPVATSTTVAQALKDLHIKWGDIIPPSDGQAGTNWTAEGQLIYKNDCNYPQKSGPIVMPLSTTPSSTATPSAPVTAPAASEQTVTELPHTGAGSDAFVLASIVSGLIGAIVAAQRSVKQRFVPTL